MTFDLRRTLAVMLFASLMTMAVGSILGKDGLVDPFESYSDIMPGSPRPSSSGWNCQIYPPHFHCFTPVHSKNIRFISVSGYDDVVTRTGFSLNLRYADLLALFGRPNSISGNLAARTLRWYGIQGYIYPGSNRTLDYLDVVSYVSFFFER